MKRKVKSSIDDLDTKLAMITSVAEEATIASAGDNRAYSDGRH